jgi:hypothetical protein
MANISRLNVRFQQFDLNFCFVFLNQNAIIKKKGVDDNSEFKLILIMPTVANDV